MKTAIDNLIAKTIRMRNFYNDYDIPEIDVAYNEWKKGNYFMDCNPKSKTCGWFIDIDAMLPVCEY